MDGKWLGNGWGISNLCAPLRGIPGRGVCFPYKSALFHKKCLFGCFYDKTSLFIIKRPYPFGCMRDLYERLEGFWTRTSKERFAAWWHP